jgi:hypothetical protein
MSPAAHKADSKLLDYGYVQISKRAKSIPSYIEMTSNTASPVKYKQTKFPVKGAAGTGKGEKKDEKEKDNEEETNSKKTQEEGEKTAKKKEKEAEKSSQEHEDEEEVEVLSISQPVKNVNNTEV